MNYFKNIISFEYKYCILYNGKDVSEGNSEIEITMESYSDSEFTDNYRLLIKNKSDKGIYLSAAYPLVIENLDIAGIPHSKINILKQCKHKNDLPGSFNVGKKDGSYDDAFNQLPEQGSLEQGNASNVLVSD